MRIGREDQAEPVVGGEAIDDDVHHRMQTTDQVLPEELAPDVAELPIGDQEAALSVDMADEVVLARHLVGEVRQQRPQIPAAVGHDPDPHLTMLVPRGGRPQSLRLRLAVGAEQQGPRGFPRRMKSASGLTVAVSYAAAFSWA